MVSAVLADALSDPLPLLLSLPADDSLPARAAAFFRAIFKSDDALSQIPPLSSSNAPPNTLVRFRAMVQDTSLAPELYPALLPSGRPGAFGLAEKELLPCDRALDVHNLAQRHILWAVSVPGESPFVSQILDDEDPVHPANHPHAQLRHKDPLSRPHHLGLQIKLYDDCPLKPTDLHTFVGFFSLEQASFVQDDSLPLPTLHVLFSVPFLSLPTDPTQHSFLDTRAALIRWIADEALAGDTHAAEWVLLASLARVLSRSPALLPLTLTLSHFPNPPPDSPSAPPTLPALLAHILPLLVPLPLSLPLLNDPARPFAPVSRGEDLHAGLLQLPAGSTVLLMDGAMAEGTVSETGLKKLHALQTAASSQTLAYDFPFAPPYIFPTDLAFIVLTEGRTSPFLETHITVPLAANSPGGRYHKPASQITLPAPPTLAAFRALIARAKTGTVRVSQDISQFIQDEFVRERQDAEGERVTAEDLMTRMSVARLMAVSRHDAELSREVWAAACALDTRRKNLARAQA